MGFRHIATLKTAREFREYAREMGAKLDCDDSILTGPESPLLQPLTIQDRVIGNRWATQPMEGWDATQDGHVTDPLLRRWRRFGESGAKLIWGGEAMAVRPDARANPNQLIIDEQHETDLRRLRETVVHAHYERFGRSDDLLVGFQITHSGRFSRPYPDGLPHPRVAYRHPILDARVGISSDEAILTDDEVHALVGDYVQAARVAWRAGADFIDIKHCHGYLLHEFLSAHTRPGRYGGSLENRTRLVREIIDGIRSEVPGLLLGVRLSAFDLVPFKPVSRGADGSLGTGVPEDFSHCLPYRYGFAVNQDNPVEYDLAETIEFLRMLESLGVELINLSAGSPYYNPHVTRPAFYPPSDGYQPPEEPLVGVARQIDVVKTLKAQLPRLVLVGSGYTYLQEYLPHVAQFCLREGYVDSVGLGRAVLSYPHMLADATTKGTLDRRLLCRTYSDCTTAPRNGLPSGCYPLDSYYKNSSNAPKLKEKKIMVAVPATSQKATE